MILAKIVTKSLSFLSTLPRYFSACTISSSHSLSLVISLSLFLYLSFSLFFVFSLCLSLSSILIISSLSNNDLKLFKHASLYLLLSLSIIHISLIYRLLIPFSVFLLLFRLCIFESCTTVIFTFFEVVRKSKEGVYYLWVFAFL